MRSKGRPDESPVSSEVYRGRRFVWSRIGFVSLWVIAFGLIAARVASSWEKIVGSLASAPRQETLR